MSHIDISIYVHTLFYCVKSVSDIFLAPTYTDPWPAIEDDVTE
jgi:hypothetical protein